ncbi:MAG TPA: hypothetical protein VFS44_06680 [Gemmatimonadaceae bacterium]|nr:hypothetical protein [Gemmatimonadaceae bacterium]
MTTLPLSFVHAHSDTAAAVALRAASVGSSGAGSNFVIDEGAWSRQASQ